MKKLFLFLFALVVSIGTAWADKTIYFNPGVWTTDDPALAAYVWGTGGNKWIDLTTTKTVGGSTCYVFTVSDEYLTGIIFTRAETPEKAHDFDNLWNRTNDITPDGGLVDNMLFKITGWQQADHTSTFVNMAMLGTATASRQTLPAVEGADGFTNTRWGTQGGTDTEWFQIAWDTPQTFNTIKILCEGAMNAANAPNLAFDIQTSDDGTTWTNRKHVWGKNGDGSYITVVLNENVSAKYVRFQGVKQGQYGYSFWEFEVYNIDYSSKTLNSIALSTYKDKTSIFVDGTIALSVIGKTADDEEIPTGTITWNNSTPVVGTVTNETFNALTTGTTTISASAGSKSSEEITFTVTTPQVLGSVSLPYRIWSATQGVGGIIATVLDTDGNDYEGDVTLSWEGAGPVGAVINGKNITFGAASGAGNYTLKATSDETSVTTPIYMIGTNPTAPTAASTDVLAIFSGTYGTENYNGWDPGWEWGYGSKDIAVINGDNCVRIHNVGTYGFPYPSDADLTQYAKLHFDIYTVDATNGYVKIEKTNINNKAFETTAGTWTPIEIDLTGLEVTTLGNYWIDIYIGSNNTDKARDILIDNVYFVKANVKTANFKNHMGWENVYAYAWTDGGASYLGDWPGTPMTKSGDVYTITFDPGATIPEKIVFNNGGTGDFNQTADLEFVNGKTYDMGYYVAGNMNSWGVDENYVMSLNTYCTSNVEYKLGRKPLENSNEFKVVLSRDGSTVHTWYPGGDKPNYTITANGDYNIFFRPNKDGDPDWHEGYIWAGTVGDLEDLGTDPTTGAQVLDGTWNADDFAALDNNLKANSYDLTGVEGITGTLNVINKTANPYCMFITKSPGQVNRNEVVWDATNNRYNGFAMEFKETANATAPFDINTNISPIFVNNPLFHRLNSAAGRYVTLTIPYDYNLKDGHKAYTMSSTSSASGITISFTEVAAGSKLTKNTPYLYYTPSDEIYLPTPGEVTIDWNAQTVNQTDASFVANFENMTVAAGDNIYVLPGAVEEGGIEFFKAGNVTIRPFRAYITVPAASGAKINVVFDDATGIHAATTEQIEGIFNIYSIDGKLVRQNTDSKIGLEKGIYIINGKKVVIK